MKDTLSTFNNSDVINSTSAIGFPRAGFINIQSYVVDLDKYIASE